MNNVKGLATVTSLKVEEVKPSSLTFRFGCQCAPRERHLVLYLLPA